MKHNYMFLISFRRTLSAVFFLMLSTLSWAYDFEVDGICYNINNDGTSVEVTYKTTAYYNSYSGDIVIPSTVTYDGKTYSVTSIGDSAFRDCWYLTSVSLPDGMTSIGNYAFHVCSLTSINIPSSVTSIGDWAFYCSSLTSMTVSAGNTIYDSREGCNAIIETSTNTLIAGCQSTTIPSSVTSIGNYSFSNCSFTSIDIPFSVTSIGDYAFSGCSLTSIDIPFSVTSIGDYAFSNCFLTSIDIPSSVWFIGNAAFTSCPFLTSMTVSADNPCYDSREGCNAIIKTFTNTLIAGCQNTTIPSGVTTIGDHAFDNCLFGTSRNAGAYVKTDVA